MAKGFSTWMDIPGVADLLATLPESETRGTLIDRYRTTEERYRSAWATRNGAPVELRQIVADLSAPDADRTALERERSRLVSEVATAQVSLELAARSYATAITAASAYVYREIEATRTGASDELAAIYVRMRRIERSTHETPEYTTLRDQAASLETRQRQRETVLQVIEGRLRQVFGPNSTQHGSVAGAYVEAFVRGVRSEAKAEFSEAPTRA